MLLRWVINFQFLKEKTPSQANRLFVWALLRQLCDHKASESTGIIMLLTLSTVICSQQKWKNNQIDLSMSHVPWTTILDRIREVVFSRAARPYQRQEDLNWVAHAMKKSQAGQTHVTREGECVFTYHRWRAGVALQATVENIRDFVWEIYYWDLRTLNNAKPYFFFNEMNKEDLPAMYSTAFWWLFVILLFFFLALLRNHRYSFHITKE